MKTQTPHTHAPASICAQYHCDTADPLRARHSAGGTIPTSTAHTPEPWDYLPPIGPGEHGVMSKEVNATGTFYVATCHEAANAAHIVECVNERPALLAEIKALRDALDQSVMAMRSSFQSLPVIAALKKSRAALAIGGEKEGK